MSPSVQLDQNISNQKRDMTLEYQELLGALLYISRWTRPDIAFAVGKLSRFFQCCEDRHMKAAKEFLRYLSKTRKLGLSFKRGRSIEFQPNADQVRPGPLKSAAVRPGPLESTESRAMPKLELIGYSDADYAGDKSSSRSTSGILFTLNGTPITWTSKRQTLIALSSTESEYVALATACKEGIWLRNLFSEMSYFSWTQELTIHADSQSAMRLAENPEFHDRTKHIAVRWHFIRWLVATKQVAVEYTESKSLVADALTKALPAGPFWEKVKQMNLTEKSEPRKRKALMSKVVVPKKFNLNLMWTLMLFLKLLTLGMGEKFQEGSPVIWRRTQSPAVIGYNSVNLRMNLVSPCTFLPFAGLSNPVVKA